MIGGRFDYGLGACECPQFFILFFYISFGFSLYGLYNINVIN